MKRCDSFHCIEGPTYTRCVREQIVGVQAELPIRDRSLLWLEWL
jgi:hypothetical protein